MLLAAQTSTAPLQKQPHAPSPIATAPPGRQIKAGTHKQLMNSNQRSLSSPVVDSSKTSDAIDAKRPRKNLPERQQGELI